MEELVNAVDLGEHIAVIDPQLHDSVSPNIPNTLLLQTLVKQTHNHECFRILLPLCRSILEKALN